MRTSPISILFALLLLAPPARAASAPAVTVTPAVIDEKAVERDILKETVTLRNAGDRQLRIYPVVNNLTADGKQEFRSPTESDYARSLANWIEFTRAGITLEPGEVRRIDFEIRVSLGAPPGLYHAVIAFPTGPFRAAAEAEAAAAPGVAVNVEVREVVDHNLQLKRFAPLRRAFWQGEARFEVTLQNAGNRPETPRGDLILYDRDGAEVGSVAVNPDGAPIESGATGRYELAWRGGGMGEYKALLSVAYGPSEAVQVQDTVFFWMLPWRRTALAAGLFAALLLGFLSYLRTRLAGPHVRHPSRVPRPSHDHGPRVVDLRHPHHD